jgi:hypothetical protein
VRPTVECPRVSRMASYACGTRVPGGVASPRDPAKLRPRGVRGMMRVSDDLCDWLRGLSDSRKRPRVVCRAAAGGVSWCTLARLCVQITNATWSTPRMQATVVERPNALLNAAGSRAVWSVRVLLQRGMSRSALGRGALMSHRPFLLVRRRGDLPLQMIVATLMRRSSHKPRRMRAYSHCRSFLIVFTVCEATRV